jgi:hypothetical protein
VLTDNGAKMRRLGHISFNGYLDFFRLIIRPSFRLIAQLSEFPIKKKNVYQL